MLDVIFRFYQGDVDTSRYTYKDDDERAIIDEVLAELMLFASRYPKASRLRRFFTIGSTTYAVSYFPSTIAT